MAYLESLTNKLKIKRLRTIYILYWFLLTYIVAALIFWYIALNKQNDELTFYRLEMINEHDPAAMKNMRKIAEAKNRKTFQYIGEGATFFLLIVTGAVFVFRAINRQLRQSQQQQNLMMAITHELKTPIAVTKLNLETLQKRKLNTEQQQKLIEVTIQEANRLNALCNNILLTSQIEAGDYKIVKEEIDFSKLAGECVQNFITRFGGRKIEMDLSGPAFIEGDTLLLQLALNNLLDNAIKYSGKEEIVLLKALTKNRRVTVQIIDEGPGIHKKDKEKIFEKYYRGDNNQTKGTGLGLYLTKKIIKEHNGSIHF
ncbi:MAG: ATP-binding protein, partial [Bacteroidota bacterium]|nr:ATP-binding protein [Bacteroidota bacterium]